MTEADILNGLLKANIELSLLVLIVLLIRKPFARLFGSAATYGLWLLPVAGFFLPRVEFTLASKRIPEQMFALLNNNEMSVFGETAIAGQSVTIADQGGVADAGLARVAEWPWLLIAYIAVGLIWLLLQGFIYRNSYRREFLRSASAGTQLIDQMQTLQSRLNLNSKPILRISNCHDQALSLGILKPMIILPRSVTEKFAANEIEHILLHELMHFKRRDIWSGFFGLIFRAVNWINPFVHLGAFFARIDMEAACDASVMRLRGRGGLEAYLRTLLKSARSNKADQSITGGF